MKTYLTGIVILILFTPAMAKDNCLSPDCSWINTKNGDLTATAQRGPYDVAFHWQEWGVGRAAYKIAVRNICSRPGNTCTKETREWLVR